MSTIKANAYLDASGGNTATINGLTPISLTTLNASGSAPVYACRAWVNFNGTGTPAIRGSGNVSSITDNGTGDFTVNFATAMPDANYSQVTTGMNTTASDTLFAKSGANKAAGSCRVFCGFADQSTFTRFDLPFIDVAIFR